MSVLQQGLLISVLAISLPVGAREKQEPLGVPYFEVVTPAYPTESVDTVRLDIIVKVPYDAVQFLRKDGLFAARFEISTRIVDDNGYQVEEKILQRSAETESFRQTVSSRSFYLEKLPFLLKPGKYKCSVVLTDLDTHKSGRRTITEDLRRFEQMFVLSDLLLVNRNVELEGFPLGAPVIPPEISDVDSAFNIYYEARMTPGDYTLTSKTISAEDEILTEDKRVEFAADPIVRKVLVQRSPDELQNKLRLSLELVQNEKKSEEELLLQVRWLGLTTYVSDLDDAIEQLRYIASHDELKEIQKAKSSEREELFRRFWQRRDPTPETTENELMNEYYRRIRYANEKFGAYQAGWMTAMGMIFILFGPPDEVEINPYTNDGRAYQKWHYYVINRTFIFVDRNGFGEYDLVEPRYPYGTFWR